MSNDLEERDDKCVNCLETDQKEVKVKCEECPGDLLLCLECFSLGAEVGPHKKTHNYSLYDPGMFPLLTPEWSAADEAQLLEALEEFGYGDWEQCTRYLTDRSGPEIHAHFEEFYLSGVLADGVRDMLRDPASKPCLLSPSLTVAPLRVEITKIEGLELGYLPKRDDFEREYDNAAEELISKLVATHNDEPIEARLKFTQVQIYNKRLKDRAARKKLAREYGLVCPKHAATVLKGKKFDQKDLRAKLQPLGRFMTYNQFEKLSCGITKSEKLKAKIAELQAWRVQGVTKIDDCREYEVRMMKREKRKREEKIGNTPPKRLSFNSLRTLGSENPGAEKAVSRKCLSEVEKELCSTLQLPPNKYLTAKMCIIREKLALDLGLPGCYGTASSHSNPASEAERGSPYMGITCPDISLLERQKITEYLRSAGYISLAT